MNSIIFIPFLIIPMMGIPLYFYAQDIDYQQTKDKAHQLSEEVRKYMEKNMPSGCSFSGDSGYISCFYDSLDTTILNSNPEENCEYYRTINGSYLLVDCYDEKQIQANMEQKQ